MTIDLPDDLEHFVRSLVQGGRFASEDELVVQAVRTFLRALPDGATPEPVSQGPDPLLGSMRDCADELDAIVADAMGRRREETWRDLDLE